MRRHIHDLLEFNTRLELRQPFTFVRFSDGETEILQGSSMEIGRQGVSWSRGSSGFIYPEYDFKKFEPRKHKTLAKDLLKSAEYHGAHYYKGVPRRHNRAPKECELLLRLNGGNEANLTYADLFLNSNYKRFLNSTFLLLKEQDDVIVVGNWRMSPAECNPNWLHVSIPDSAFDSYDVVLEETLQRLSSSDPNSIILSSASSLSNVLGHRLHMAGSQRTFIDIGTALHPFMGMGDSLREYQSQLLPWTASNFRRKFGYQLLGNPRFKW